MANDVKITMEGESIDDQLEANRLADFDGEAFNIDWTEDIAADLRWMAEQGDLAQYMTDEARMFYGTRLMQLASIDDMSRADWLEGAQRGEELTSDMNHGNIYDGDVSDLGDADDSGGRIKPRFPLVTQAIIDFASHAGEALLSDPRPVKASMPSVAGSGNAADAQVEADAVSDMLSWQVMTVDRNWLWDTDRLLHALACSGTVFRKRWFDKRTGRNMSKFIMGTNVIINNNISKLSDAPRITEEFYEYPHVIRAKIQAGEWYDVDIDVGSRSDDWHAPVEFLEMHTWLDLDGDGADEPYKVIIQKETGTIVHCSAGWTTEGFTVTDRGVLYEQIQQYTAYHLIPSFEGKFYSKGFGHLLGRLAESIDELVAAIIETAQLNNENSGVIGRIGTGMQDTIEVRRNKLAVIPTDGQTLQSQIALFPTKDVSPAMFSVLGLLTETGQRLASSVNLMEAGGNMPAATAMAITDQGSRVYTAILKRIWNSMGDEFTLLYDMNRATIKGTTAFEYQGKQGEVNPSQFQPVREIQLSADPRISSAAHRAMLSGYYAQFVGNPNTNQEELHKRMHTLMRVPDPESLIVPPPQQLPPDVQAEIDEMKSKIVEREVKAKLVGAQAANNIVDTLTKITTLAPTLQGTPELAASFASAYGILQQIATLGATNDLNANGVGPGQPQPGGPNPVSQLGSGPGNSGPAQSLIPPPPTATGPMG